MNCHQARRIVFLCVDRQSEGQIEEAVLVSFQEHVHACPACAGRRTRVLRVVTIVRQRCCREEAPPRLRDRILQRLRSEHGE